ncbi:MAG: chorismate synthase [bacterium]
MLRFLTAGESHGKCLVTIIEGFPAGLKADIHFINEELRRRQIGYGRGKRMEIERDKVEVLSGIRVGKTTGAPISLLITNKDYPSWKDVMPIDERKIEPVLIPRPGHSDLGGYLKYGLEDLRDVIERASARETAARVAAGALAKLLLREFNIHIFSFTLSIGKTKANLEGEWKEIWERAEKSPLRCPDEEAEKRMMSEIEEAKTQGDSLGGIFQVVAIGIPPGLGSYVHWDRRLDARLAYAVMSIPSVKGVEIGEGFSSTSLPGSRFHDEIFYDKKEGFFRITNRAGGIEGGVSNGEAIIIKGAVKPIPTLSKPLHSVHLKTKSSAPAHKERADICVVPSAGVIAEAMTAWVLADAFLEKFGSDCLDDIKASFQAYLERLRKM